MENKHPLLSIFLALIFIPTLLFIDSYVLSHLWNWFIQPLTHITINRVQAIGIGLIGANLTYQWIPKPDELTKKQTISVFCWAFLFPLYLLFLGKIIITFF